MECKTVFETFDHQGALLLPEESLMFKELPWNDHPSFDGVSLKHLITSKQTNGAFSYHLVRILPNKEIGNHVHETQIETHEVISGSGYCINNSVKLAYEAGMISIFQMNQPHAVVAGPDGLYLFAKFIPALL